jgi:hypothetical protein
MVIQAFRIHHIIRRVIKVLSDQNKIKTKWINNKSNKKFYNHKAQTKTYRVVLKTPKDKLKV